MIAGRLLLGGSGSAVAAQGLVNTLPKVLGDGHRPGAYSTGEQRKRLTAGDKLL